MPPIPRPRPVVYSFVELFFCCQLPSDETQLHNAYLLTFIFRPQSGESVRGTHYWVECLCWFTNGMVRGRVAGDSVADVGPASVMVGNIVQGNRLASAQGRDMGILDEDSDSAKKVSIKLLSLFV